MNILKKNQNPLLRYFQKNDKRLIHKWMHYFDIYHRHFERFKGKSVRVLEFGVFHGGSLQMWKKYFGKKAIIFGVDINPQCLQLAEDRIKIFIGDQENKEFLYSLKNKIETVDVVIEDGGHTMLQQIHTFEEIYPMISENGVFLIEDLHTSYWSEYGGEFRKCNTFIEYAKNLIDQLNAWHSRTDQLQVNDFTKSTHSVHIYDSIMVFEKAKITQPYHLQQGKLSF